MEDDIAAIYDYCGQYDPALPSRFDVRFEEQVEPVEMLPGSGAFLFESYRRMRLERFPCMAVHVVRDDRIDVPAVIGVQRDPAWIKATLSERGDE